MDRITFKVNGVQHSVGGEISSTVMLVDYLRDYLELRGTKYMCREAGCGACIVAVVKGPGAHMQAVNSCMVCITSCQNWEITTIEDVGNRRKGYHVLQETMAKYNGTQCGYCSPAWIMSLYSLISSKTDISMLEMEQSFASNTCRCAAYRPIMDAFKTFAKDSPSNKKLLDIEDLHICNETGKHCAGKNCDDSDWCIISNEDYLKDELIYIELKDGRQWFRVSEVNVIFKILKDKGDDSYMLIYGNTAKGAYPIDEYPRVLIDISAISELKGYKFDQNLIIGAGTTLTDLINLFETETKRLNFSYLQKLADHLKLVAHIAVRNLGSIAGNLMIKHQHRDFPSDIYLLFLTIGAQLTIRRSTVDAGVSLLKHIFHACGRSQDAIGIFCDISKAMDCVEFETLLRNSHSHETVTLKKFLEMDMKGQVILNLMLPPLSDDYHLVTFKIMPRSQNAHAIVNAGFLYRLKDNIVKKARIVFGGLSSAFGRALCTENYLVGKKIFTNKTLQAALKILDQEMIVMENLPEPSAEYRKQLALALFYKALLYLCPEDILHSYYRSGATKIHDTRPVSKGFQIFDTKPSLWPLNQPMPKVEALIQCAGEALYTEDMPKLPREVFAAFVLSTVAVGDIVSIDATEALKYPGVIAFYTAKDIPGLNSFVPSDERLYQVNEEILCSKSVKYYNEPIGLIVAETQHIANVAAKLVRATYTHLKEPVYDIRRATKDPNRNTLFYSENAKYKGKDVVKVIKGSHATYEQCFYTMEPIVCVTIPSEDGLNVYSTTQSMDFVQTMTSRALNIAQNRIDVHVRRLGGAFGSKMSPGSRIAVACSLVAYKLNRPCRIIMSMPTTHRAIGKRYSCCTYFEAGVSSTGAIQYMEYNLYEGNGYVVNDKLAVLGVDLFFNCYDKSTWNFKSHNTTTDTPKNSWFRAPITLEHISMIELIMEQIAYKMAIDPLEVRLANLDYLKFSELKGMIDKMIVDCTYNERRVTVDKYNSENRWKKRGLRFSLLRWKPVAIAPYEANLSVFHGDGTVTITHSGVEMGQGINTRVVQVCAYLLKIPVTKIIVKTKDTNSAPNSSPSAGSVTSQNITIAARRCCEQILTRLKPLRILMKDPTWEELVKKAFNTGVDLQAHGFVNLSDAVMPEIFGVTLAEVEVDILTGELEVLRVDILQDAGQSVNPEIDIGQVEGAFIMGIGYWTCENVVINPSTGEVLTDRTWNYHVPQTRDIPQDLRVYLRKNSYSSDIIFGSKGIGEPPICMTVAVALAIREAIVSARLDSGIPITEWFPSVGPYTVEYNCLMSSTKTEDFKFY